MVTVRDPVSVSSATPTISANDRVIGDLIISWPDNRTSPEKEADAARAVISAAEELSTRLGYRGS